MDKDIKLQLAIAKMQGEVCLAIDIVEIFCPQKDCTKCPFYNHSKYGNTAL
jgi:hypothetical protein